MNEHTNYRYEPPITLQIANEIHQNFIHTVEEIILKECVRVGVKVERDELIAALNYDRQQYEKGFADAKAEVVRCKDCRFFYNGYMEKSCTIINGVFITDENGYCHHAERRLDDG